MHRILLSLSFALLSTSMSQFPSWAASNISQNLACEPSHLNYSFSNHNIEELFDNSENKPGPRRLVTEQISSIGKSGHKHLIQATPWDADKLGISLTALALEPKSQTRFVVCKTNPNGQSTQIDSFVMRGNQAPQTLQKSYADMKYQRLSLHLSSTAQSGKARFKIDIQRPGNPGVPQVPDRKAPTAAIKGWADVHVHQAADLAFAGGWVWGSHREGNLAERLPQCSGHNHATVPILGLRSGIHLLDPHDGQIHGAPDFKDWPSWKDIKHQQVSAQWLKEAHDKGLQLMVASLVNNQWVAAATILSGTNQKQVPPADMESVKAQLISLQEMDEKTDWYTIVRDPWEARRAIARGELAVVLAVEVSDLMPASDGPWQQQLYDLYDMGVRSIQIVHQTNSIFSGAAFHRDALKVMNQIKGMIDPHVDFDNEGDGIHNPVGLSQTGYELLDEMVRLNILVDVAHTPLKTQRQIFQYFAEKHQYYPMWTSHTRMDDLLRPAEKKVFKEFVTIPETLEYFRQTGGIVGLRTGEEAMKTYENPIKGLKVANNCDGSARSFTQFYQYADDRGVNVALASDFNGFITQVVPRFGPDACANASPEERQQQIKAQGPQPQTQDAMMQDYYVKGLAHMGLLPALVQDMRDLGADTRNFDNSAENFIRMWERTYDPQRTKIEPDLNPKERIAKETP